MCISHFNFPQIYLRRCTGEADAMISSTQLTDMDGKRIGKSGPGVQHTCRPGKAGPMKFPDPNGQTAL